MKKIFLLLVFMLFGFGLNHGYSQRLVKEITWDSVYFTSPNIYWMVVTDGDTILFSEYITDTSVTLPQYRNERDFWYDKYILDSTKYSQSKIRYDAKVEQIDSIENNWGK